MNPNSEEILSSDSSETIAPKAKISQQIIHDLMDLFGLGDLLNHTQVIKQVAFFLFIIGIAVFHIYNSHKAVKMVREQNNLENEIKELRWEQISLKSDLMKRSMQSDIEQSIQSLGLKRLKTPPYKIEIQSNED
ncbi:MAG TPA: FtsL-like putative cell division protein [Chitinophagales bacterium]|nr:FtsL-like putative cell division protein [Chitinophagales bacterium]